MSRRGLYDVGAVRGWQSAKLRRSWAWSALAVLATLGVGPSIGLGGGNIFDDDWTSPVRRAPATHPADKPVPSPTTPPAASRPATAPAAPVTRPAPPPPDVAPPPAAVAAGSKPRRRQPVPTPAALERSRGLLRAAYGKELADRSPRGRRALAAELLKQARDAVGVPPDQYTLLAGAIDAARQGADLRQAMEAATLLAAGFDVDPLAVRVEAVLGPAAAPARADAPDLAATNARAALDLTNDLLAADDLDAAARAAALARAAAVVARDPTLVQEATARVRTVDARRAAAEALVRHRATLRAVPDDPAANLAVGRHLCLVRGDWAAGLPLLAKGADPVLAGLAKRDLANPATPDERVELGIEWWDAADAFRADPAARDAVRLRAYGLLAPAVPRLTGLRKTAVVRRLAQAPFLGAPAGQVQTLSGHEGTVYCVAFAPDGGGVLSGGNDGTVRQWDLVTGTEARRFKGHTGPVFRLDAPRSGRHFVTASADHTCRVWDLEAGTEVFALRLGSDCWSASIAPDGRAAVFAENMTAPRLHTVPDGRPVAAFKGEGSYSSAWSANGQLFATGGFDGRAHVYDARTGTEVARFPVDNHVYAIGVTPDGRRVLAGGGGNKPVRVFDLPTGRAVCQFNAGGYVKAFAFTADSQRVLVAGGDAELALWDVSTGARLRTLDGVAGKVRSVATSADGRLAASCGDDGLVRVWKLPEP